MKLENGYETCTTFWEDFSLADRFGANAIKDTFEASFKNWQHEYKYMTELACVMSWKSCAWYGKDENYMIIYANYYHKVDNWCMNNLKGDELAYYLKWTD